MNKQVIQEIKKQEDLIEEKRLAIKEIKNKRIKFKSRIETAGNIYEYFATPACAISITLVALFTGPIIYVLPAIAAAGAISVIMYKFLLNNKIDKLDKKLKKLKDERQSLYDEREAKYESIFNDLYIQRLDDKDYYHQIVNASNKCNEMTESLKPHKVNKKKLEKVRNIIHNVFDYGLAPLGAVLLPLLFAYADLGTISEVLAMGISSTALFGCVMADERLTQKIEELERTIGDIKDDRTVCYVQRDVKLKEALDYLKQRNDLIINKNKNINQDIDLNIKKSYINRR